MAKENKNNVTANNASENDAINVKEVTEMNKTQETTVTENIQQEQQIPAEQQAQVPAEEPEVKETFWQKTKRVGKKIAKGAGVVLLVVGGCIVGEKIGEAVGFDKATDNYNKLSGGNSSGDDPEDEITIDIGESDPIDVE
jgi:hypothetical protein